MCLVLEVEVKVDVVGVKGGTFEPQAGHHLRSDFRASSCMLSVFEAGGTEEGGLVCLRSRAFW